MIELDGSFGEGGGQILRSSLALSLLTGQPFHLRNVRARRSRPGLQPQHLMSVRAAAAVGQAQLRGGSLHSTDLTFEPGEVVPGHYDFPIGTAGATGLVLHTVYLPLAFRATAPSHVTLGGGTHNSASPAFHFLNTTWRGYLDLLGLRVRLQLRRPGFYPRGGGVVEAHIQPAANLQGLDLESCGTVTQITGTSAVAGLPEHIAARQARQAQARLDATSLEIAIREERWEDGPATVLNLELDTQPVPTLFFGLGARGKRAEQVADEAADEVLAYLAVTPTAVDEHSADQLVLPLALAEGPSRYRVARVSRHLLTNITVVRRFVERDIDCTGAEGEPGVVQIAGA
jgi:RNA 3'-terminal phosphate cyclase (ATP)